MDNRGKQGEKILKSKKTALSKGEKVPSTVYAGLNDSSVIRKTEKKTKKAFNLGSFKPAIVKGTKTPFGLKKLPCRPVVHFQTPKSIVDNTSSTRGKYKAKGFPTEKFLSFPRNDFVI